MQCPYCNEEMKKGYIQSPRQKIFWGEEKRKIFITPSGTDVSLSEGIVNNPAVESYCCQKCRKIIVEFLS
jgi:hypothetical protein